MIRKICVPTSHGLLAIPVTLNTAGGVPQLRLETGATNAVVDYIATGGIDAARLQISGMGSAEPIADDGTRYGRSLNRRIEIAVSGNY